MLKQTKIALKECCYLRVVAVGLQLYGVEKVRPRGALKAGKDKFPLEQSTLHNTRQPESDGTAISVVELTR